MLKLLSFKALCMILGTKIPSCSFASFVSTSNNNNTKNDHYHILSLSKKRRGIIFAYEANKVIAFVKVNSKKID